MHDQDHPNQDHNCTCNCGHDHHQHNDHCGCGHDHHDHHQHGQHCGCHHTEIQTPDGLSTVQVNVMLALYQRRCLPVAAFSLTNSANPDVYSIALAPVYLNAPDETLEQVKWLGAELSTLEQAGLITLDYDIGLTNHAYAEYHSSAVYAYFVETAREAAALPGSLFDTPQLELGSMALTQEGEALVLSLQ